MSLGSAKTNDFMLGTAALLVGPQEELFNLTAKHSLGLVKNVTTKSNPGFVELKQGIKNSLVASVMNANDVSIMAEMYEYTPQNIAYSLSLDGSKFERLDTSTTLTAEYAAPAPADPGEPIALGEDEITLASATGFTAGKSILIHTGNADNVMLRKILSIAGMVATLDSGMPVGFAVGSKVEVVNILPIGATATAPFLSAKIIGTLSNGETVVMLFPKVRIKSGLTMAFKTDAFDHIPLELDIFDLVETDPHYEMFAAMGDAKGMIVD